MGNLTGKHVVGSLGGAAATIAVSNAMGLRGLGDIGDKKAVGPLINALRDDHQYVQMVAAKALGKIGHKRATRPLIQALKGNWLVHENAIRALGKIGDFQAVDHLIRVLQDTEEEYEEVRTCAARVLGKMGYTRALPTLILALTDEDIEVSRCAAKALGEIGDERAKVPLICSLETSSDEILRMNVICALGHINDKKNICLNYFDSLPKLFNYFYNGQTYIY